MIFPLLFSLLFGGRAVGASDSHLEFEVLLDDRPIGTHRFDILRAADGTSSVSSVAVFDVKILGITAYRYRHEAREKWAQGCLVADRGQHQRQRPQDSRCAGAASSGRFQLEQAGHVAARDGCVVSYAYWDPERLLRQRELLNPQTGQFDPAQIESLGEEDDYRTRGAGAR